MSPVAWTFVWLLVSSACLGVCACLGWLVVWVTDRYLRPPLAVAALVGAGFFLPAGRAQAQCYSPSVTYRSIYPTYSAPVVKEVVKVPEYIGVGYYAPFAVAVPYYGGTYNPALVPPGMASPPQQQAQAAPQSAPGGSAFEQQVLSMLGGIKGDMTDLKTRVSALEAERRGSPTPGPALQPPPPASTPPPDPEKEAAFDPSKFNAKEALQIFSTNCAGCHEKAAAPKFALNKSTGKAFVMFEGNAPTAWTGQQRFDVLKEIEDGTMPKAGKDSAGNVHKPLSNQDYQVVKEYLRRLPK